ncbi:MAG: hypothetical protein RLZZ326_3512, partial [Planctomycetota bacterium]
GGDLRTALVVNDVERRIAAEQHASGSGGFMGDWSKAFTYVVGGLQMAGAVIEVTVGANLLVAAAASGATGVGIPIALMTGTLGAFMVGHGLDNLNTGFQTIVTGAPQRTLTSQALDSLTGNKIYSEIADTALGLLSGAAAGKILRLAAMTDDMGRCLNMMGRMFYGGCFTGDTLVHVTAVADREDVTDYAGHGASATATATATQCLAIAKVPIGARVLAINPRPVEFDDSFAEPVQSEWARVSFLIVRNDLSLVEAEFIRPREWIESLGLVKGARIDLAVPELEIDGLAEVTAVRPCPPIADGEGRVVTGRFVTRDVANVVRITLASGTEIRATDVHPVWSVDRKDWVPAGKLEPGEYVDTLTGPVAVASVEPLDRHPAVYNLEVHGEHVYRIAVEGMLVHNMCPDVPAGLVQNPMFKQALQPYRNGLFTNAGRALTKHPNIVGASSAQELIKRYGNNAGINDAAAEALKNIMRQGAVTSKTTKAFGEVVEFKLPIGLGARFNAVTNEFITFLGRGL